jgi:hypothetical protein
MSLTIASLDGTNTRKPEAISSMTKALSLLLSIALCITLQCNAFAPSLRSKTNNAHAVLHASSPTGNLISGITGVAPSSLSPPLDVLSGTSIDPTRDDVDLDRVYKVCKYSVDSFRCFITNSTGDLRNHQICTVPLITKASKDGWSAIQ